MNITNEKLYETIVEIKTAQSELRADIIKWGVALFIGSVIVTTSILGVVVTGILLTLGR